MKQTISKLALTLGLILMFCANAWAGTATYTVKCTVDGAEVTMGANTYGYTITTTYRSYNGGRAGVENGTNNSESLPVRSRKDNQSAPTVSDAAGYITANSVTGYEANITGNDTTITIAYTKQAPKTKTYTVQCTVNGVSQAMGTYGYTIKQAYTETQQGVSTEADATTLTMSRMGDTPTTLTTDNIGTYITAREVANCTSSITVANNTITIAYQRPVTYNVTFADGAPAGAGFTVKNGATMSGNTITVAANLSAQNVGNYVAAVAVAGYDAEIGWDGTNVTITYAQLYTANYNVVCTVDGTTHALDNSFGYDVKRAYSASAEGVASAKNANPLVMQNLGEEPSPLTEENLATYIAPITNANYDATMSIEGTTITIAYVVKPAESNTWTVTCTLNGTTQTMNGTYGYTIKTAYNGSNTGIYNSQDDATSFTMRGAANLIDSITNANYTQFITVRQVEGCQVKVEIRRGSNHTIRIIYNSNYDLVENDLCYKITSNTNKEVSVSLANYDAKSVTVPSTVVINGETYNVTSIAKRGFTDAYTSSATTKTNVIYPLNEDQYEFCQFTSRSDHTTVDKSDRHDVGSSTGYDTYSRWCKAYNANLEEITFEQPCQIKEIGAGAFQGCVNLKSFTSPLSVETYGNSVFMGCKNLTTFKFETNDDGSSKLKELPDSAFYGCQSIGTLRIPEGITEIGDECLKYMLKMTSVTLPNTLTTIGKEFLCTSLSLETLTLPASVTSMGGGSFHGCNALRSVYLLGPASALDKGSGSNETFMANQAFCADGVNGCTFYTTSAYIDDYKDSNWKLIDQNGETNWLKAEIPGHTREFTPGKWVTFSMPQSKIFFDFDGTTISPDPVYQDDVSVKARPAAAADATVKINVDVFENGWTDGTITYDGFGENCKVAKLVEVTLDETDHNLYHTKYQLIDHSQIKPYLPYFILPEIPVDEEGNPITDSDGKFANLNICMWNAEDEVNGIETGWNAAQTTEHVFSMRCEDSRNPATIQWIAQISRNERLYPQDIYFKSNNNPGIDASGNVQQIGTFKIIPSNDIKVTLKSCSAFWRVLQDGVSADVKMGSVFKATDVDPTPNGINEIENDAPIRIVVDGIYDMSGRKLDVDQSQLPEGMYIMNGKKVLNK